MGKMKKTRDARGAFARLREGSRLLAGATLTPRPETRASVRVTAAALGFAGFPTEDVFEGIHHRKGEPAAIGLAALTTEGTHDVGAAIRLRRGSALRSATVLYGLFVLHGPSFDNAVSLPRDPNFRRRLEVVGQNCPLPVQMGCTLLGRDCPRIARTETPTTGLDACGKRLPLSRSCRLSQRPEHPSA